MSQVRVQKIMTQPIVSSSFFFVSSPIESHLSVSPTAVQNSSHAVREHGHPHRGRHHCTTAVSDPQGFDEYMNVTLDDAYEVDYKKEVRKPLGLSLS